MSRSDLRLFLDQASSLAPDVDRLFLYLTGVTVFFSLLIATLIVLFVILFRQKGKEETGKRVHEHPFLEIFWMGVPLLIALSIFAWGAVLYIRSHTPPPGTLDIFVLGKQWMWKLQHPDGKREINELHVPVNQPIKLTMTSEDVIHSFYVPAFRIKMDVLPGRYTTTWFQPTKVGEYHLFCAEYCGTKHAGMIGKVVVLDQADYEKWLAGQSFQSIGMTLAQRGEELFAALGCQTCHISGSGAKGPNLIGVHGKMRPLQDGTLVMADETYLRESILRPMAKVLRGYEPIMPTFIGQLDEEKLLALVTYIKSLRGEKR